MGISKKAALPGLWWKESQNQNIKIKIKMIFIF